MSDIKTRELIKGTIKTMDRSIAASNRIKRIPGQRTGQRTDDENSTSYAMNRFTRTTAETVRRAESRVMRNRHKLLGYHTERYRSVTRNDVIRCRSVAYGDNNKQVATLKSNKAKHKQEARTAKRIADRIARAARAIAESTRILVTALITAGWGAVLVIFCCVIFGAAVYLFGDNSSDGYIPVSPEVEAYTPIIREYADRYGIGQYTELIKAIMMQESGGKGDDPMQSSECKYNKKYPKKNNGIKDPEYSIMCGVRYLADNLALAKAKSPVDMDQIRLAVQGYNYGTGYISWTVRKYGGYSYASAIEYSEKQAEKKGVNSYGDSNYAENVLRYYPYGNYTYDVIYNGPGKIGLPIKGMKKGNISSYFGSRSSPGGIGSTYHQGLDIAFGTGTKVLACETGTVVRAGWYGGYGKCIIIDHGKGLKTLYGHLSAINVKSGQKVVRGQYIGNVGSTGNSTGPHLHLGVIQNGRFVNPAKGWLSIS